MTVVSCRLASWLGPGSKGLPEEGKLKDDCTKLSDRPGCEALLCCIEYL